MDFITITQKKMETIYTLTGWVKKVIDNEHAQTLDEIHVCAVGDLGKETLVKMAIGNLEMWQTIYANKKGKKTIAFSCSVFSNKVNEKSGILTREETVFVKLVKIEKKK